MSSNLYQRIREPRSSYNKWDPTTEEVINHVFLKRIRNNQNVIGAVCGETGSGKSWTALRIGEMVDPGFGIDSVVFSAKEFLESFESHSRGDVVVFDEGQEFGSRRAMSKKNVEMTDVLTMLRFTQVNVLFTTPNILQIDISLRRLMHLYLDVRPVDRTHGPRALRNKSLANIYLIRHRRDPGGNGDDMRRMHPDVPVIRDGMMRKLKVDSAQFLAPSPSLVEAYEAKKRETFRERLHRAVETLGGPSTPVAPVTPPQADDEDLTGMM